MDEKSKNRVRMEKQKEEKLREVKVVDKDAESKIAAQTNLKVSQPLQTHAQRETHGRIATVRLRCNSAPAESNDIPEDIFPGRIIPVPSFALPNLSQHLPGTKNIAEHKSVKYYLPTPEPPEKTAVVGPNETSDPLLGQNNIPGGSSWSEKKQTLADILKECCSNEYEARNLLAETKHPAKSSGIVISKGATTSRIFIPVPPAPPTPATPPHTPEEEESFCDRNKRMEETRQTIIAAISKLPYARIAMDRMATATRPSYSGTGSYLKTKFKLEKSEETRGKQQPSLAVNVISRGITTKTTRIPIQKPPIGSIVTVSPPTHPNTPAGPSGKEEGKKLERKVPSYIPGVIITKAGTVASTRLIPRQPSIVNAFAPPVPLQCKAPPNSPAGEGSSGDKYNAGIVILAAIAKLPYYKCFREIVQPSTPSASAVSFFTEPIGKFKNSRNDPPPNLILGAIARIPYTSSSRIVGLAVPPTPPNTPSEFDGKSGKLSVERKQLTSGNQETLSSFGSGRNANSRRTTVSRISSVRKPPASMKPFRKSKKDEMMFLVDKKQPIHLPGTFVSKGKATSVRIPSILPIRRMVVQSTTVKRPIEKVPSIPAPKPKNGTNIPTYLKRNDIHPNFTPPSASWRFDTVRKQVALNRSVDRVEAVPKPDSNQKAPGKESDIDEDEIINVTDVDSPEKEKKNKLSVKVEPKPPEKPSVHAGASDEVPSTSASTNTKSSSTQTSPSSTTASSFAIVKGTGAKVVSSQTKGIHRSYSLVYKPAFPAGSGTSVSQLKRQLTPGNPTRVVAVKRPAEPMQGCNTSAIALSPSSLQMIIPSHFYTASSSANIPSRAKSVRIPPRPPILLPPNKFKPLPLIPPNKGPSPAMVYASSRLLRDSLRERTAPPGLGGNEVAAKKARFDFGGEGNKTPKVYTLEELRQRFKDATNDEVQRHRSNFVRRLEATKKPPRTDLVACNLCGNHISVSRFTNLTNHVKRHCAVKQFKCIHCDYQHNECAKVRLHMFGSHHDNTDPLNKVNEHMENSWKLMLNKCFPEQYNAVLASEFPVPARKKPHNSAYVWQKVEPPGPSASFWATFKSNTEVEMDPEFPIDSLDKQHVCDTCGERVETDKTHLPLVAHLWEKHADVCLIFECDSCGYSNSEEGIVQWHVCTRHDNSRLLTMPFGKRLDVFVRKFFPTFSPAMKAADLDQEEACFLAQSEPVKVVWYAGNRGHSQDSMKIPRLLREKSEDSEAPVGEAQFVVRYLKTTSVNATPPPSPSTPVIQADTKVEEEEDVKPDAEKEKDTTAEKIKEKKRSSVGEDSVFCELCEKVLQWTNKKTVANLLAHAKRHFRIKQFQCKYCNYDNSEAIHVRTHHLTRHNDSVSAPKSNDAEYMHESWRRLMKQCFPPLTERIDAMKFNKSKRYNPTNPPTPRHHYGTRSNTPKAVKTD